MLTKKAQTSCLLPGQIESKFRRKLGRHNLCLNLLQIATRSLEKDARESGSEALYVREKAKEYGFHSLHPEAVSIKSAKSSLFASHIAFIMSSGDVMCKEVRSSPYIKRLKSEYTNLYYSINTGDFIKKTVSLVVMASLPPNSRAHQIITERTGAVLKKPCFALADYYRLLRNDELHAEGAIESDFEGASRKPDTSLIGNAYGFQDKSSIGLTSEDALICSKAWQDIAKWLCRNMFNEEEQQIPELKRRFANLQGPRRTTGARNFMEQAFLFSAVESEAMLATLGW